MHIPDAKILIVDDDMVNLKITESVFRQLSVKVHLADSGKKALEMLREQRFDVVFMDQMMPEMSGKETIEKIREMKEEYFKKLPVFMLSAQEEDLEEEMKGTGILGILSKPVRKTELEAALKKLFYD